MIDKVALVYGQMNEPPGARLRVGLSGLTMAEYFRDQGQDVLLFIDNIFRFVQAGSEVSALLGRMPSAVGYQPTLATEMGQLQERITSTRTGSVTSVQAIYVPADDLTDPAPANTFAHLDSTVVLSRAIVEQGIYPAVDPLDSFSRALQPGIVSARALRDGDAACRRSCSATRTCRTSSPSSGMDELSDEDKLTVAAGAQDPALPLAAELRGRAVHRHARRVREARGHDRGLPGDHRRQARRPAGAGVLHGRHDRAGASRRRRPPARSAGAGAEPGRSRAAAVADLREAFSVSLVTPEGPAFEGESEMLIVPGAAGEIGVLARHAPLVAMLRAGSTRVHVHEGESARVRDRPRLLQGRAGPRARARRRRGRRARDRRRDRAQQQLEEAQAELEQVEARRVRGRPLAARAAHPPRREPARGRERRPADRPRVVAAPPSG